MIEDRTIEVLKKVIVYQNKRLNYNSYYDAFLLGILSEKMFQEFAKDYIIGHQSRLHCDDIDSLIKDIRVLRDTIPIAFSVRELSDIFQVKDGLIIQVMEIIIKKKKGGLPNGDSKIASRD